MAPLSNDLSGLIFPHDLFGNHLGENGKTTDINLEKRNFFNAAVVFSDVWSKTVISGHPADCVAVPVGQNYEPPTLDSTWVS